VEALEAIRTRRSIRKYKKTPVTDEMVDKILEAGRWAPSSKNAQPWKFIVLRDSEVRRKLSELLPYGKFLAETPLGIAVIVDPSVSSRPVEDGAAVTENMLLAAHALGLGACWIGSYGIANEGKVKDVLGVPQEQRLLSVIALGYADESPQARSRKSLDEIAFNDRYGTR
jgi:nitroreductase